MSEELQGHLDRTVQIRSVPRGNYILRAGHVSRHIHYIREGLLRSYYVRGNTEICSGFMKEGDIIASTESFYEQKESCESIQALEDCTLYYIDHNELQYIYRQFPEFNFIGRVLTEKYHRLCILQLNCLRLQPAFCRYQWMMDHFPELILRVPAKFIASYLGITEVTLSNVKSRKMIS